MDRLKAAWARLQRTRVWRAQDRYLTVRGNLLAAGVAYYAFFSVFPAVLLAFTIFGLVLRSHPEVLEQVENAINGMLPGFVKTADNPDGIINVGAPTAATLSVSGVISLVGLFVVGIGWLGALRAGIRAVFGVDGVPGNFALAKLRDLGVLALLGLAIVVSAVVGSVVGASAQWLAGLIGMPGQGWPLEVVATVIGVVVDGVIIIVMLRVLSGVAVPAAPLFEAAVIGGVGLTVLKRVGAALLTGTLSNPLYASFAVVVGLLVWLNLMSRIVLLSAAWAADGLPVASVEEPTAAGAGARQADSPSTAD